MNVTIKRLMAGFWPWRVFIHKPRKQDMPNFAETGAVGRDQGFSATQVPPDPVSCAGDTFHGVSRHIGVPELAAEVVTLTEALETAEEAICNFAEQRNEAMREVDRLLVENARLRNERGTYTDAQRRTAINEMAGINRGQWGWTYVAVDAVAQALGMRRAEA